ncbi:hypothetical protein PQR01_39125, partial [Paraburkholderia rhynchosiae]
DPGASTYKLDLTVRTNGATSFWVTQRTMGPDVSQNGDVIAGQDMLKDFGPSSWAFYKQK